MKKILVWLLTIMVLFAVAGCEKGCEKERRLTPSERKWIEEHPDGEKRDGPEDFEEFVIKDRCDPEVGVPWQWKKTFAAEDPEFEPGMKPENIPPTAVMTIELKEGTTFEFSGVKSRDPDDGGLNFQWTLNWKVASTEPEFELELERGEEYHVVLNVWNLNEGDRSGNSYKMGSSIDFDLVVDNLTCPEE